MNYILFSEERNYEKSVKCKDTIGKRGDLRSSVETAIDCKITNTRNVTTLIRSVSILLTTLHNHVRNFPANVEVKFSLPFLYDHSI